MNKDHKKLFKQLEKQGWTIEPTRNGHIKAKPPQCILDAHPDASPHMIEAVSGSDPRGHMNLKARIRREYGVAV